METTDDSEAMNRYMFICKGGNVGDRESLTCYAFELPVKLHKVHKVSDSWLLVKYDRVKTLSACACALPVFDCLWCFQSKWDNSLAIGGNRKQISAFASLISDK